MKQEEKRFHTRTRIIEGALKEFGEKSYENASLTLILEETNISKGLFYHNFKSKDDIYLECLKICFQNYIEYFKENYLEKDLIEDSLKMIIDTRKGFFNMYPYHKNIFFNMLFNPPKHLSKEISEIKKEFNNYNHDIFNRILEKTYLREGISKEDAANYLSSFINLYNLSFKEKYLENKNLDSLVDDHEINIEKLINILMFGLVKEGNK